MINSSDKVNIALIGLDHWYTAVPLASEINKRDDTELVAIWDSHKDRAREIALSTNTQVVDDWRSIINRDDVDAIASFVKVDKNAEIITAAAEAGKHIICVKPVAMNLAEVDVISAKVKEKGIVMFPMEGYYRLIPYCKKIKELLNRKMIGDILNISIRGRDRVPIGWKDSSSSGWFGDPLRVPGGAWLDHGIYQLALVRWLLEAEPKVVQGKIAKISDVDIKNEDYGMAIYGFSNGTIVSMEYTWTFEGIHYYQIDIIGKEGMISYLNRDDKIWLTNKDKKINWIEEKFDRSTVDYLQHFIDCIKGETKPVCTIEDAKSDLLACLAFYEAANKGKKINIYVNKNL